jgi:site-specific recombinase XerD
MTVKAISPLRRRLIEDMAIRRLGPKTQLHYIRHVKRFADFLGRSADKATTEDVRRYQVWLASIGTTVGTVNAGASALRFFFKVTLKRPDLVEEIMSTREPRRLPVALSPEEVGRLLASTTCRLPPGRHQTSLTAETRVTAENSGRGRSPARVIHVKRRLSKGRAAGAP